MSKDEEKQVGLGIYQDDDIFQKVKKLARPYDPLENSCKAQLALMEDALEVVKIVPDEQQQGEIVRLVADRDPIMWHLLCLKTNIDVQELPSEVVLKKFILTLKISDANIRKDYRDIIRPKLWGKPLQNEYMKFEHFAEGNIPKGHIELLKTVLVLLFVIACIYLMVNCF